MAEVLKTNGDNKRRLETISTGIETKKPKLENTYEIRENLKEFVRDILKEEKITPYELSRITGCHETTWDRFLRDEIHMPSSKTLVALADYKKVPLDKVVGRDLAKEVELKSSKEKEFQIPAFLAKLSPEALQSVMEVREKTAGFAHKSSPTVNEPKKSFVDRVTKPKTPTGRSR